MAVRAWCSAIGREEPMTNDDKVAAFEATRATLDAEEGLRIARAVLWHYGDQGLGLDGGHFVRRLLVLASACDPVNLDKLAVEWPAHIAAWKLAKSTDGIMALRDYVKRAVSGGAR